MPSPYVLLGLLQGAVRVLHHVRPRSCGEDPGHQAGGPRREDKAGHEASRDPLGEAERAGEQLANPMAPTTGPDLLVHLTGTGRLLVAQEWGPQGLVTESLAMVRDIFWVATATRARSPMPMRSGRGPLACARRASQRQQRRRTPSSPRYRSRGGGPRRGSTRPLRARRHRRRGRRGRRRSRRSR